MGIEQSIIQQARQTDLPSFLLARGEPLKKDGKGFYHSLHDSLRICRNMYFWNSKGTKGNSLNFMMDFYNMTFKQAIAELTGEKGGQTVSQIADIPAQKVLEMPVKADNAKRVWAYLIQTRKISQSAVKLCFDQHLIYQDTNGNTVFRMTDGAGVVVGAEIMGTSPVRYKGIAGGSKSNYGFNIKIGDPARMCVFESAIDLLSFITLNHDKLNDRVLVSMAGLKEHTLLDMAKLHDIELHNVCCCVDNDDAGRLFADDMRAKHGTRTYLPQGVKDWNDVLRL